MNASIHNVERIVVYDSNETHANGIGKHASVDIFARGTSGELVKFSLDLYADKDIKVSFADAHNGVTPYDIEKLGSTPLDMFRFLAGEGGRK